MYTFLLTLALAQAGADRMPRGEFPPEFDVTRDSKQTQVKLFDSNLVSVWRVTRPTRTREIFFEHDPTLATVFLHPDRSLTWLNPNAPAILRNDAFRIDLKSAVPTARRRGAAVSVVRAASPIQPPKGKITIAFREGDKPTAQILEPAQGPYSFPTEVILLQL
jgi:hypothetical protein